MHPAHPNRRTSDRGIRRALAITSWSDPVRGGQALLLITLAVATLTYSATEPGPQAWWAFEFVTACLMALLVVSLFVPWASLPRAARLVFPGAIWLALAGLGAPGAPGGYYLGLFALTFVYIGLVLRSGSGLLLAPIAAVLYIAAAGGWTMRVLAPLVVAVITWVLVAEAFAALQSRQRELATRLRKSANTDPLTGLANRADLDTRLETARSGDLVMICDVDDFDRFVATFGAAIADQALTDYGLLLSSSVRTVDYAARVGAQTFAILMPRTDLALAPAILGRLRRRWTLLRPNVTFSTGVACCHPNRTVPETLAAAEQALYRAKKAGRNRDFSDVGPLVAASDLELDNGFVVGSVNLGEQVL